MIHYELATPADAEALTQTCILSFEDFARRHGYGKEGCPPGYDSAAWQLCAMHEADYYKILQDGRLIGGLIIYPFGQRQYVIGRIFLAPEAQGQGLGRQAMLAAEAMYPQALRWSLNTPDWALSNQRFYEGLGYQKAGVMDLPDIEFPLVVYEKWIWLDPTE